MLLKKHTYEKIYVFYTVLKTETTYARHMEGIKNEIMLWTMSTLWQSSSLCRVLFWYESAIIITAKYSQLQYLEPYEVWSLGFESY